GGFATVSLDHSVVYPPPLVSPPGGRWVCDSFARSQCRLSTAASEPAGRKVGLGQFRSITVSFIHRRGARDAMTGTRRRRRPGGRGPCASYVASAARPMPEPPRGLRRSAEHNAWPAPEEPSSPDRARIPRTQIPKTQPVSRSTPYGVRQPGRRQRRWALPYWALP